MNAFQARALWGKGSVWREHSELGVLVPILQGVDVWTHRILLGVDLWTCRVLQSVYVWAHRVLLGVGLWTCRGTEPPWTSVSFLMKMILDYLKPSDY